jgi:hypothetical protein
MKTKLLHDDLARIDQDIAAAEKRKCFYVERLRQKNDRFPRGGYVTHIRRMEKLIARLQRKREKLLNASTEGKQMNPNQRKAAMSSNSKTSPGSGWWLRTRRTIRTNGKVYPPGCAVDAAELPNLSAMVGEYLQWAAPHEKPTCRPIIAPPSIPARKNPDPVFVDDEDCVEAWRKSLAATAEAFGGDWGRARDLLEGTARGGDLFRLASRVLAERNAREQATPGRRIAVL